MKKVFVALGLAIPVSAALWLPSAAQSEDTIGASLPFSPACSSITSC